MTTEQRTRLNCCLLPCPVCAARRGEYCLGRKGARWKYRTHGQRALRYALRFVSRPDDRAKLQAEYEKLRRQVG